MTSSHAVLPPVRSEHFTEAPRHADPGLEARAQQLRARRNSPILAPVAPHLPAATEEGGYHQAELFYLQKQIQSQTTMVIVLEDGEQLEGCIEWYDRNCLKVRGRSKTLVYKSAIKYMYKHGEQQG